MAIERSIGAPWATASGLTGRIQVDFYSGTNAIGDDELVEMVHELEEQTANRYRSLMFNVASEVMLARALHDENIALTERNPAAKAERLIVLGAPDLYLLQGQSLLALDRTVDAEQAFRADIAIAETHGLRRLLDGLYAQIGAIEIANGDTVAGQAHRAQARELLEFIATHTGSEARSVSFRGLPAVKAVLDS